MEVVSTPSLVSSETEKTTAACNLQHDYAMRDQYEYEAKKYTKLKLFVVLWQQKCEKAS